MKTGGTGKQDNERIATGKDEGGNGKARDVPVYQWLAYVFFREHGRISHGNLS